VKSMCRIALKCPGADRVSRGSSGRHCRKHASARFRHLMPRPHQRNSHSRTSSVVNYERTATNASDGSINRYYAPSTGQFLSVDPLDAMTGQPYGYSDEDPVNGSDPTGLAFSGALADSFNPFSQNEPCARVESATPIHVGAVLDPHDPYDSFVDVESIDDAVSAPTR
jgi:RHS repeat-associated protein